MMPLAFQLRWVYCYACKCIALHGKTELNKVYERNVA